MLQNRQTSPLDCWPSKQLGWGRCRGLVRVGETFAAVAATGTAGLQLPVRAPRGRFGLRTSLALSYDSGAGNGPFGPGRHLDSRRCCARVLRKTGKGLPWGASPGGGGVRSGFITP
ncbi:SpvB/TcaC N-terminal domain-containing protein [Streptomyces sp. NPDC003996]